MDTGITINTRNMDTATVDTAIPGIIDGSMATRGMAIDIEPRVIAMEDTVAGLNLGDTNNAPAPSALTRGHQ